MSGEKHFSRDEEMVLIELVSFHNVYDSWDKKFKDNIAKDNVWKEIAFNIEGKTDDECKKRWRSIRDTYKRLKRSGKLGTGSSAAVKRKKWPLFDYLSCLETVPEERSTISNIEKESQESNDEAVSDADHNLVEETQSTIIDLRQSSIATPSTSSVASTCTPVRAHKRKMTDNISKLLEENKKAREKIVETFLDKTNVPQEDDVDVFYRSIALSVKRLPRI
ncbi:unnamed protein product [Psylliodes chrysocephalus]|uniref:MADF domain-containing protein n=1 Tax=Psylliodes chrysocephalus TaxID=3402493 RepID=A0A9P0DB04_9CUCU|nr:unnamed protein product [Psylliodes chrysocephala]